MITDSIERIELSAEEEKELIRAAREKVTFGDSSVPSAAAQAAKERLIAGYAGVISRAAKVNGLDWDEAESALLEAFLRAIEEYDFQSNNRLNYEIKLRFREAINGLQSQKDALKIPSRTKRLYYQILYKEAEGVWSRALNIVSHHPLMSHDTFVAIGQAMNTGNMADVEASIWNQAPLQSDYEMVEFVRWLLAGLNERERLVIDLRYGFDHEPATDLRLTHGYGYDDALEIPQIASLIRSHRQTAWRVHNEAINKMRSMVNADGA